MVDLPVEVESLVIGFVTLMAVALVLGMLSILRIEYNDNLQLVADIWRAYESKGCVYGIYRLQNVFVGNDSIILPHYVWWNGSITTRITNVETLGKVIGSGIIKIKTCFNNTLNKVVVEVKG